MRISRRQQRRNRTQSRGGLLAEINVVPYIDVMLVLLVIFMVTVPLLNHGINIKLPAASKHILPSTAKTITISINKNGKYFYNQQKKSLTLLQITNKINSEKNQKKPSIQIRADKRVDYAHVADALSILQKNGLNNVALLLSKK